MGFKMRKTKSRRREIYKRKYFITGIFTILIFIVGFFLGIIVDNKRIESIRTKTEIQEIDLIDLQLQYDYLNKIIGQNDNCEVMKIALESAVKRLGESLSKVEKYEEETATKSQDYIRIKKKYLLDNIRYWNVAEEAKEYCNLSVLSVLYFYSDSCEICPNQGVILSYYKNLYGDSLLVFPLDASMQDIGILRMIILKYNITELPSLVINNKVYSGVVNKEELKEIICNETGWDGC
jgi:hypothetical protein